MELLEPELEISESEDESSSESEEEEELKQRFRHELNQWANAAYKSELLPIEFA